MRCPFCLPAGGVWGIAWKAILSEAVVTGGEALGSQAAGRLSVRQYLVMSQLMARYCLTGSRMGTTYPRASPPCSSPSGQIASESDRFA